MVLRLILIFILLAVLAMSTGFNPVNGNGSYFDELIVRGGLAPLAVLGLHVDLPDLSIRGVRGHWRRQVMTHMFERVGDGVSASSGPRVPTWSQVNQAEIMLCNHGAAGFE